MTEHKNRLLYVERLMMVMTTDSSKRRSGKIFHSKKLGNEVSYSNCSLAEESGYNNV